MVPHRKFLQLMSILRLVRPQGEAYAAHWLGVLGVKYPVDFVTFTTNEVYGEMPITNAAFLMTTDPTLDSSEETFRLVLDAAAAVGVDRFLKVGADGLLGLSLPDAILRWREEQSIRVFLETCMLVGVSNAVIAADMRRMWGADLDDSSLETFRILFCDQTYVRSGWLAYERCLAPEEAAFKRSLVREPQDYVRWRLGVPVALDSERVLDRLISDAYYTERLLKQELGDHGVHMTKDHMTRIKLERDTIFKGLDRKAKLKEAAAGSADSAGEVVKLLGELHLKYEKPEMPTIEELTNAVIPDPG